MQVQCTQYLHSPTVGESQVKDPLRNLKMHESMGHDEVHLWVLMELKLLSPYPSYLRSSGILEKFPVIGKVET